MLEGKGSTPAKICILTRAHAEMVKFDHVCCLVTEADTTLPTLHKNVRSLPPKLLASALMWATGCEKSGFHLPEMCTKHTGSPETQKLKKIGPESPKIPKWPNFARHFFEGPFSSCPIHGWKFFFYAFWDIPPFSTEQSAAPIQGTLSGTCDNAKIRHACQRSRYMSFIQDQDQVHTLYLSVHCGQ